MESLIKNKKREYYKPFRSLAGFILGITFISNMLISLTSVILSFFIMLFGDNIISNLITELFIYGSIIYSYYIGYRIFIKKYTHNLVEIYHVKKEKILSCILSSIIIFIIIRLVWIAWELLLTKVGYVPSNNNDTYLIGILYIVMGAPIIEEIIFRGWFLKILKKYGVVTSVIISSLTFGIFHGTVIQFVPATIIGVLLSYIAIKYNSIIPGIILHISNNLLSVLQIQINQELYGMIITCASVFTVLFLLLFVAKNFKKITNYLKSLKISFDLIIHSISYILFLIIYIVLIILDYIGSI